MAKYAAYMPSSAFDTMLESISGQHCAYRSKMCYNPRAMKPSGQLHRLCQFHRQRANLNQKRMQERRRLLERQQQQQQQKANDKGRLKSVEMDEPVDRYSGFTAEDLEVLEMILFNDRDRNSSSQTANIDLSFTTDPLLI